MIVKHQAVSIEMTEAEYNKIKIALKGNARKEKVSYEYYVRKSEEEQDIFFGAERVERAKRNYEFALSAYVLFGGEEADIDY